MAQCKNYANGQSASQPHRQSATKAGSNCITPAKQQQQLHTSDTGIWLSPCWMKSMSRWVTNPRSFSPILPFSVIGIPENPQRCLTSLTSATVAEGNKITGSTMKPCLYLWKRCRVWEVSSWKKKLQTHLGNARVMFLSLQKVYVPLGDQPNQPGPHFAILCDWNAWEAIALLGINDVGHCVFGWHHNRV